MDHPELNSLLQPMMEIYRKYFLGRTNFLAETISLPAQYYTLLPVRPDPLFVVFLRQPNFDCAKGYRKESPQMKAKERQN